MVKGMLTPEEERQWRELTEKAAASGAVIAPKPHDGEAPETSAPMPATQLNLPELAHKARGEISKRTPSGIIGGAPDPTVLADKEARWQADLARARQGKRPVTTAGMHADASSADAAPPPAPARDSGPKLPTVRPRERADVIEAIRQQLAEKLKDRANQSESFSSVDEFNVLLDSVMSGIAPAKNMIVDDLQQRFAYAYGPAQLRQMRDNATERGQYNRNARSGIRVLVSSIDAVAAQIWGVTLDRVRPPESAKATRGA